MFYKPEIRKRLRAQRRQLDKDTIIRTAKQVATQVVLLPPFIESKKIAFYCPQENEVNPQPTIDCAIDLGKSLYLPVISTKAHSRMLTFYSYHPEDPLVSNHYSILEPNTKSQKQTAIEIAKLDIVLIPIVAFDSNLNRLGRGAGYYDYSLNFIKTMASPKPILIGLAYEFQRISEIKPEPWDVPLNYIVTETKVYR